jgi:CheY-like chemotaxis protein
MALTPQPLIVAVTGWGDDRNRERSSEAGFDHHLTKPADLATVKALLDRIARDQQQE